MPELNRLKLADKDDADVDYRLLDELRTSPTLTFTPHAEAAAPADTKLVSRARAVMISVGRSYNAMQCKALFDYTHFRKNIQTNISMLVRPLIRVWKDLTCNAQKPFDLVLLN